MTEDDHICVECGNNRIYGHELYCTEYPGNKEKVGKKEIQIIIKRQLDWAYRTRKRTKKK